ncbi:MAG: hydrogenase maturation protease [Phycisphaerales bacterium]|nr:hydrogenase maturation protease [Phycisphaerales bacterium]
MLIIGYGNTLRHDDAVGPMIVQWLRSGVSAHQLLPEHAELVSRAKRVIFIDASISIAPGKILFYRIREKELSNAGIGHYMSPETILKYAKELYGRAPEKAHVIAIGAASLEVGEGLTPRVESVARRLVKHLSYWLTR